ncbi:MAG: methyltransferase [Cenarchaeum symbiont of Oopsacas minuta]|nr:methyltransferase [Cenarchaeum symbiont of Oopsacas minuta]
MDFLPRCKGFEIMDSISATSALVLLMGRDYYTSASAKKFLNSINLDSGLAMKKLTDKIWLNYGEIVKNRKDSVYRTISNSSNEVSQVVILAAGYDAQALNIVENIERFSVFEVDMYNMDDKAIKYDQILDQRIRKRISTITCDVTSKNLISKLENAGLDIQKSTIIVAEGISYYLQYDQFWDIVSSFSLKNDRNRIVLDYMVPLHMMDFENSVRMSGVFNIICDNVGINYLTMYEYEKIRKHVLYLKGKLVSHETLHKMELARTGKSTYFRADSRGGIETCSFDI